MEVYLKMEKAIKFGNTEIEKTVVSNKVSFGKKGFKYFIGYKAS